MSVINKIMGVVTIVSVGAPQKRVATYGPCIMQTDYYVLDFLAYPN